MKTRKLITCDDAFRAHLIQGALENEGIFSVLLQRTILTKPGFDGMNPRV